MAKKILAIYYSQSGQLKEIINNFCAPFINSGITVEKVQVTLKNDYPFPWNSKDFFDVMPDCVLGVTAELAPIALKEKSYDLIVIGYQPWFLSPSIPFNSLMFQPAFRQLLNNAPVITITGARNMWVNAFTKVKKMLNEAGAKHVGTIALVDRHLNLVSIFIILHWMLHGENSRYLGLFPRPGVCDKDISNTERFGAISLHYLQKNKWDGLKEELINNNAARLRFHLMFMESKAAAMF